MRGAGLHLLSVALLGACGSGDAVTSVRLSVVYDDAWSLDSLELTARDRTQKVAAARDISLLVPDEWAGETVEIEVWGGRAGTGRVAWGSTQVTPTVGQETAATVTLALLPCGAWCTVGATACDGDATVVCEQRDTDDCMEWSAPTPCPVDAPYCSLGACRATCIDECAEGESRCVGPDAAQTCGQSDGDTCLDWLPATACTGGATCTGGACQAGCQDECSPGDTDCAGGELITCADKNHDGCAEWGPAVPCGDGMFCDGGACTDQCSDECSAATCDGLLYRQCGEYDGDPCIELSPGTSCVPADPCLEGSCAADGCHGTARECLSPPASECIDADTLRVYDAAGTCQVDGCQYPYQDVACAGCPACDTGTCAAPLVIPAQGGALTGETAVAASGAEASCGGMTSAEQVYTWTPATCGSATVSTCDSGFDTLLYVRDGDCAGAELACANDTCGSGESVSVDVKPGRTYTVVVDGWAGATGTYGLTVTPPAPGGTWIDLPAEGAPSARFGHTAVWTGKEMIVWGGSFGIETAGTDYYLADGARFDPATGLWAPLPTEGAPTARGFHSAVWTGKEMIVWGGTMGISFGSANYPLNDGGRFDPETGMWTPLPTEGAPYKRFGHSAVWTGTTMIVWGGASYIGETGSDGIMNDGGAFDPETGLWTPLPTEGAPVGRYFHSAVWTGTDMVVWGGAYNISPTASDTQLGTGGRFEPAGGAWTDLAVPADAMYGRYGHTAVWTGDRMIIWGGAYNVTEQGGEYPYADGWRGDIGAGVWSPIPKTSCTPQARWWHSAVWTGSEMLIWGGIYSFEFDGTDYAHASGARLID